ncbi:hypothetical protein GCM10023186_17560 [Hymenobacter koreensis]|uniref:Uncharacterized protein n=1 Tax=Hymenobacter koreensis TaxID=1084523 RepID=A0ABP8IYC6_9BACT
MVFRYSSPFTLYPLAYFEGTTFCLYINLIFKVPFKSLVLLKLLDLKHPIDFSFFLLKHYI